VTASLSTSALAHALVFVALDAADKAENGSVIAATRLCFDVLRRSDPRIGDPSDGDIAALLRAENLGTDHTH
jgi:hypothetical protein